MAFGEPLIDRVRKHLISTGQSSSEEIADELDENHASVESVLRQLRQFGEVEDRDGAWAPIDGEIVRPDTSTNYLTAPAGAQSETPDAGVSDLNTALSGVEDDG